MKPKKTFKERAVPFLENAANNFIVIAAIVLLFPFIFLVAFNLLRHNKPPTKEEWTTAV